MPRGRIGLKCSSLLLDSAKDVLHTHSMCGSSTWPDHKLVKCKLSLCMKTPRHTHRQQSAKKLNIDKLKSTETRAVLSSQLQEAYAVSGNPGTNATTFWDSFKRTTLKVAEGDLAAPARKYCDWFDDNDPLIKQLLADLHDTHLQAIEDMSNTELGDAYRSCKQQAQKSLRNMQNTWWKARAADMQEAANKRDFKTFC